MSDGADPNFSAAEAKHKVLNPASSLAVTGQFHEFVSQLGGRLAVQPRMGFSDLEEMRAGLRAVRDSHADPVIGTITVDAFTRQGMNARARAAIERGERLNGFPVVAYGAAKIAALVEGLRGPEFPVQVRHGTPDPRELMRTIQTAGIDVTEGGPVSYSLPYSRVPLARAIPDWREAASVWAEDGARSGITPHLETFGGCMLGQACPPSMLLAIALLEARFFCDCGIRSVSLSYAQNTNPDQDIGAILALRRLASDHLTDTQWHVIVFTLMGRFPRSLQGARRLSRTAPHRGDRCSRLIVNMSPGLRHPDHEQNVEALQWTRAAADEALGIEPSVAARVERDYLWRGENTR